MFWRRATFPLSIKRTHGKRICVTIVGGATKYFNGIRFEGKNSNFRNKLVCLNELNAEQQKIFLQTTKYKWLKYASKREINQKILSVK